MNIKHLGSVIIAVSNLEKSLKFYNEIIGLPIKNKRENWVELVKQGATVILHPASSQLILVLLLRMALLLVLWLVI